MDIKKNFVKLGNINMKEKFQEKYLGDILFSHEQSDSVKETIRKREAKIKGAVYELRALTKDYRMQAVGGCQAAIELYESCLIPSLLTNAGTWVEITEEAISIRTLLDDSSWHFLFLHKELASEQPWAW